MQNLIINITQENFTLLEKGDIGCFILPENLSKRFKCDFIEKAHKHGALCLLSGASEYADYEADGVVLDLSKEEKPQKIIKEFKKKNPKALLGVISRNRRHEAMLISECEPEFIIFKVWADGLDKNRELLQWYAELFLIQSAVWPQEDVDYASLPADFIIKNDV